MAIVSVTMELALEEVPIYAGGLGVLEGDKFRHMSRIGKEYYVITLFHRNGYVDYQCSGGEFVPVGQGEILSRAEEILERGGAGRFEQDRGGGEDNPPLPL